MIWGDLTKASLVAVVAKQKLFTPFFHLSATFGSVFGATVDFAVAEYK